jgi:hypothetical protein
MADEGRLHRGSYVFKSVKNPNIPNGEGYYNLRASDCNNFLLPNIFIFVTEI